MTENYYQILEIQKTATIGEIKKEAEEKFKKINEAYSTLINPIKKSEYDTSMFVGEFSSDFDTQSLFDIELSSIHSSGGAVIGLDDNSTREYQEAKRRIIENIKRTIND
ncbi:10504_t:CDS:2 [Racocetra persica]|uniref:10504_t:CDS:1 n=1 Tax=Racocetra persica TaxID=160502 RepID=A0ACA9NTP1_9GLOM|nr:10504_t:CDS:2 [Racocetra persica]